MVDHYEGRIEDLRAGGAPESETETDLGARDEPNAYDGDAAPELSDRDLIEEAEAIGWTGAADAIRERQSDAEPGADDDTATSDLSPREAAEKVNELRNKRLTAVRMGDEEMIEHYEDQIVDLIGDRSDIGGL